MRIRSAVFHTVAAAAMLASAAALASDEFQIRVFDRGATNPTYADRPYFDWLGNAPNPVNIYYGRLPLDGSFGDLQAIAEGQKGSISLYDPTFKRKGYQTPAGSEIVVGPGEMAYFLMSSYGGPQTCGYSGSIGMADVDGDGVGEPRTTPSGGDSCDTIGRGPNSGNCGLEWPDPAADQYNRRQLMEATHRCKVILLIPSAMWCNPCKAVAMTAEKLYQDYRDPDNDGVEDFVILEVLSQDEFGNPADPSDALRWAEGQVSGGPWTEGTLTFPVIADGDYSDGGIYKITHQYWPAFPNEYCYPMNMVFGADFVMDYKQCGAGREAEVRTVIEKNLCEVLPSGTTFGNGNSCP